MCTQVENAGSTSLPGKTLSGEDIHTVYNDICVYVFRISIGSAPDTILPMEIR